MQTRFGRVSVSKVLNTDKFSFEEASMAEGWLQTLRGEAVPETEECGISSSMYRRRRPFHPRRLFDLVTSNFLPQERADDDGDDVIDSEDAGDEGTDSGTYGTDNSTSKQHPMLLVRHLLPAELRARVRGRQLAPASLVYFK